jgi:hypothetical protein
MKKLLLTLILALCSITIMAQTPMDIFSKHRPYKVDGAFLGTAEFEYLVMSRSMIQSCTYDYLMNLGVDTTYLREMKIIQYIAIFHSISINFEDELDLSCYQEVDAYTKNGQTVKVFKQVRFNKFEEIISLTNDTNPEWHSLVYVQGITVGDMEYEH